MAVNPNHRLSESSSLAANADQNREDDQQDIVFPVKLYRLLDEMAETGQTDIISWMEDGDGFKIKDRNKFVQDVLPKFFGTNRLKSFQRNLNLWGFASGKKLHERGIYTRSNFLRGHPELCLSMQRCKGITTATGERKRKRPSPLPNEQQQREESSSSSSSSSSVGSSDSKEEEDDEDKQRKPQSRGPDESLTENTKRSSVSSEAIMQVLRRTQHDHLAQQQEAPRNHTAWIPSTSASAAALSIPQLISSLVPGVGTGLSHTSTTRGNTNFHLPWLGSIAEPTAAAAATTTPPSLSFRDNSIAASAIMNAYISSQQPIKSTESSLMQNVSAILLQQHQQQQEQAAAAARNDQLIANILRDYAAADDEQKRKVTAFVLMLLDRKKAR